MLDLRSAANFRNVIKIAVGIGLFQVDGGRNLVVLHGNQSSGDTRGATGALRVSNLGFQPRHRNFIRMVAQCQLERACFDAVIQVGRCAVQVHVLHVFRSDAGFFHSQANSAGGLFAAFLQTHAMEGLTRRAIAGDLGIDVSAAGACMLVFFQHKHP